MSTKELLDRIQKAESGIYEEPQIIYQPTDFKKLFRSIVKMAAFIIPAILALIFLVNPAIEKAKGNPDLEAHEEGLLSILPIMYIAAIIIGAIYYMAMNQNEEKTEGTED